MSTPTTIQLCSWIPGGLCKSKWNISWGVGGVLGVIDVNYNSSKPTRTSVSVVTPQLGGGFNITFSKNRPTDNVTTGEPPLEAQPLIYSVRNRYVGFSFTDDFRTFSVNVSLATGPLPINVGLPLFSEDFNE